MGFQTFRLLLAVPVFGAALLAGGCVSTALQLSGDHPARPGAAAGRSADPAAVLRPDAALYPPAAAAAQSRVAQQPKGTRSDPYVGRGTIRALGEGSIVIQHEAIPGFMGAMTMAYAVAVEVTLKDFAEGDAVVFRIELLESGGPRIFELEKTTNAETGEDAGHDHHAPSSQGASPSPAPRSEVDG